MQPNVTPPPLISNNNRNETLARAHGIYAGLLSFSAVVFLYLEYQQRSIATVNLVIVMALMLLLIYLNISACLKVKRGDGEGRTLSRILAVLMLLSFPIGTVLGAIALWKSSSKQWQN